MCNREFIMQCALDNASKWSSNNNMLLNATKTTCMNIRLTDLITQTPNLTLDSTVLQEEMCVEFLGVYIDN